MKVLLKEDVDNLGYAGEVLQVADGYGRNFLIPRGMALKASPGVLKQAQSWRDRAAVRLAELRREHEALALRINDTNLNFYARAGETGKLYGSITTADITDQLNETLGTEVDRRIVLGGPLRQLGEHRVTVRLSRDYQPHVIVQIHPHSEEDESEDVDSETTAAEVEASEELVENPDIEEVIEETEESSEEAGMIDASDEEPVEEESVEAEPVEDEPVEEKPIEEEPVGEEPVE